MLQIQDGKRRTVTLDLMSHRAELKGGERVRGRVAGARARRLSNGDVWQVILQVEDRDGTRHEVPLKGEMGLLTPFTALWDSEAEARAAAERIDDAVAAFSDGRITWREAGAAGGDRTYKIEIRDESGKLVHQDLEYTRKQARMKLGIFMLDGAEPSARRRAAVEEIPGIVPEPPYGRFVDFEAVKPWMRKHLAPGLMLVLEETQGQVVRYHPVEVLEYRPRSGNFDAALPPGTYVQDGRFSVSGKSRDIPTGQSRLLPPIAEVVDAALNRHCFRPGDPRPDATPTPFAPDSEEEAALRAKLSRQETISWTWRHPDPIGQRADQAA